MHADWKNILFAGIVATSLCSFAADDKGGDNKAPPPKAVNSNTHITQGEFARMLAVQLGLFPTLTTSPSEQECAAALILQGISPFDGWKLDAKLSKADFARMMIQAMGKAGEIPEVDQDKPAAWIALAGKLGIALEQASDGVGAADPLVEQFLGGTGGSGAQSSNPLIRRDSLGKPDESASGTDTSFEFSFSPIPLEVVIPAVQQLRPAGTPGPRPPAPPTTRG